MDSAFSKNGVKDREDLMKFPKIKKSPFLRTCGTSIDGSSSEIPKSVPSPDLKAFPLSVSFSGWRLANEKFKFWTRKMAAFHEPTWRKAGIFEAIMASTNRIYKDTDLVLGLAEKWCPETKTFVFPWGEATITLEDVIVLLSFSVLGLPLFAPLNSSEEKKIEEKMMKEWGKLNKNGTLENQISWMLRFMNSDNELEHEAFLVLWLSSFVFPSGSNYISKRVLPVAVHLSRGTRIALAPAVLADLYGELSQLKQHIVVCTEADITGEVRLKSLFKLVQVWTWERFKELQPKPNLMLKGEPRLARWRNLKQRSSNVRLFLNNSEIDSFDWRPYTKPVKNWNIPQFYPEKAAIDDDQMVFARCLQVSELVGMYYVVDYLPNRVASQFRMDQFAPGPVPSGSKIKRTSEDNMKVPVVLRCKRRRYKSVNMMGTPGDEEINSKDKSSNEYEEDNMTIAQLIRSRKSGDVEITRGDTSAEPLGKRTKLQAENNESSPSQKSEENDKTASKTHKSMVLYQSDDSNIHITAGINLEDGVQGRINCLLHEYGFEIGETMKSNRLENDVGDGKVMNSAEERVDSDDSHGHSLQKLKLRASLIEERILKLHKFLAQLKERKTRKQNRVQSHLQTF